MGQFQWGRALWEWLRLTTEGRAGPAEQPSVLSESCPTVTSLPLLSYTLGELREGSTTKFSDHKKIHFLSSLLWNLKSCQESTIMKTLNTKKGFFGFLWEDLKVSFQSCFKPQIRVMENVTVVLGLYSPSFAEHLLQNVPSDLQLCSCSHQWLFVWFYWSRFHARSVCLLQCWTRKAALLSVIFVFSMVLYKK